MLGWERVASPLVIGILADPESHPRWPQLREFLLPAADRGDLQVLLGPHELLWTVWYYGEPVAAATTRLTVEDVVEIVLVGGRGFRSWLKPLDNMIGRWARDEGATCMRAFGRAGWAKVLGWKVIGRAGSFTAYERGL